MAWKDLEKWLENGIVYMTELLNDSKGKEESRIKNKLEGMEICFQHMQESKKMYMNREHVLNEKFASLSNDEAENFFNSINVEKTVEDLLKKTETE